MKKAIIVLANGFEETEAIVPIDVLRRAEVEVIIAGLGADVIAGAHGIQVKADIRFEDIKDLPDAIIFPGGMPGAENLALSPMVKDLITKMNENGKLIAAICASPALVLAPIDILNGKTATCYPGMQSNFPSDVKFSKEEVIQDGNIVTSRGPATAFAFGLKIAEILVGRTKADMVGSQMLVKI